MTEPKESIFFEIEGKEYIDEDLAIARLLKDGVLFCNTRQYYCPHMKQLKPDTIVLFINCNDTFVYAADAENVTTDELISLYKLHVNTPKDYGSTIFVAKRRKKRPLPIFVAKMKDLGIWDDELESF